MAGRGGPLTTRRAAQTSELKDLVAKTKSLKLILSTVPEEIGDRSKFLNSIRDIASNIKVELAPVPTTPRRPR